MKKTYQRRQIVTTGPDGLTVVQYQHTCKFTGQPFYSTNRRATYAPGSLELKRKQDEEAKQARRDVCRVYFPRCIVTGEYFTSRTPGARCSPAGREVLHQRELEYARQHRQRPAVKEKEAQRRKDPARVAYLREWDRHRYDGKPKRTQ